MKKSPILIIILLNTFLTACGGGSSSSQSPQPIIPQPQTMPIPAPNISGVSPFNLSLPIGWESNNQSLIVTDQPAVGSDARMSANFADKTYIVQTAKNQQANFVHSKKFAENAISQLEIMNNTAFNQPTAIVEFTGKKTSELAKFIKNDSKIIISTPIEVDETIHLAGLKNIIIECQKDSQFNGINNYENTPSYRPNFLLNQGMVNQVTSAFNIQNSQYAQIDGCKFQNTQAVISSNSQNLRLNNITVNNAQGYGVILGQNNQNITINASTFNKNYASAILVLENNRKILLSNNKINQGMGYSPWQSGIVVTNKRPQKQVGLTDFLFNQDYLMPALTIDNFAQSPSEIYIVKNTIQNNNANGVLIDGAKNVFVGNNVINNNNREGIALLGTHSVVINDNYLKQNGLVNNIPNEILVRQFPIMFNKDNEGNYQLKDAGISLNNVAYSFITNNTITENYGSGVYAKRASFYNVIGQNNIQDNNKAKIDNGVVWNDGINLNSMPQVEPSNLVNFAPSMGNIIYKNMITGRHQNGIELCIYCEDNEVLENTIYGPLVYSITQYLPRQQNYFKNNVSSAKSDNVNLNAHGIGSAKAGTIETRDWGRHWQNNVVFKKLKENSHNLAQVNNLFLGSSTVVGWNLDKYFPSHSTANRGFGGAESFDVKVHLPTLLGNSNPKTIFVYVGENDIASGKGINRTIYHLQQSIAFTQMFKPQAKIYYVSIKPSSSRVQKSSAFIQVNQAMQHYMNKQRLGFIDIYPSFINANGNINNALFLSDKLHLNNDGYQLISAKVQPYLQ